LDLDKTAIALRQRSFADTIDLSFAVVRIYWRSLLGWAVLGVLPFAILNAVCLARMTDFESMVVYDYNVIDPEVLRIRYVLWMASIVFLEAPLAMLGVTFFLGQSVFFSHPSIADFRQAAKQSFWGILWVLGVVRLGIIGCWLPLVASSSNQVPLGFEFFVYGVLLLGSVVCVRAVRPFAPEMLILERSPLRSKSSSPNSQGVVFRKRSKWLHGPFSGELLRRSIATSMVGLFLVVSLSFGWLFCTSIFFNAPIWDWWMDFFLFPLTLWIVAIWTTVVRFLSYLDARTRLEGWELELRLRAEGDRIREAMQ
jgi:hypothetical protein